MFKTKEKISAFLSDKGRIAMWGAGGLGNASLRDFLDKDRINFILDKMKHGEVVGGQVVLSPDDFDFSKVETVIITSAAHHQIREQLKETGFKGEIYYIYELVAKVFADSTNDFEYLWLDILAVKNANIFRLFLDKPQLFVNVTFRTASFCAKYWYLKPLYWIVYILHALVCLLTSVQLPIGTTIGAGFGIAHYGTIVFSKRAKIGSFFTIYHGCTVGTNYTGKAPVIGDFVTQYAGSHILGESHIADYCTIGANSVVLDLTSGHGDTIVGSPAKIKKRTKK